MLLAAAVPAKSGECVLEAGSGAGAGLLCLHARTGAGGIGVELDGALAEVATANAVANGFTGLHFVSADIRSWDSQTSFDHAFANPPYHPAGMPASPDARRDRAKRSTPGLLAEWVGSLARRLRHGGTLTIALPASRVADVLAICGHERLGSMVVFPLWPREGQSAKLLLVQARAGGRGPLTLSAGLVLHAGGAFTAAAESVLRGGAPLAMR